MKVLVWLLPLLTFIVAGFFVFGCQALQGLPGGSGIGLEVHIGGGKPPTFTQAVRARADRKDEVLINGNPVDINAFPGIIRIFAGNASCTAAVIGKRTILTAAHCAVTGSSVSFQTLSGTRYSAKMTRGFGYPSKDLDLNLGLTDVDIDVAPMRVRTDRFERVNMLITLIGYGCVTPQGTGGNDGILRKGDTVVSGADGYDLILKASNGAALCYGDSGGPVLYKDGAEYEVVGVNSKGNISDTSYTTRLTIPEANEFLKAWPSPICGLNGACGCQ